MWFCLLLACAAEDAAAPAAGPPTGHPPAGQMPGGQPGPNGPPGPPGPNGPPLPDPGGAPSTAGQAAPRIPPDEPQWKNLSGFQPSPQAYGESSWSDVRMRVAGHVAVATRDLARARAMQGDWAGCAAAYEESARTIEAVGGTTPVAVSIRGTLRAAAERDAALCRAVATGAAPAPASGTLAPVRQRWVALATGTSAEPAAAVATAAAAIAAPTRSPDDFADFEARHALRVEMVGWYADAVDPFAPTDPWGGWTPAEVTRQAAGIAAAAREPTRGGPARPSALLAPVPVAWTAEEIGGLPTGDALVDTAGFAGPAAIGALSVLGLDDPAHRPWLDATVKKLAALPPAQVPAAVLAAAAELDAKPFGSRYYNVKQLKNAGVRQLARQGEWAGALTILATSFPLHDQDWACPNREGILRAIEGRLRLLAGDPEAEATLRGAVATSQAFLAEIARVGG